MTPDMTDLKARLKATWMAGDYAHFATYMEPGALEFLKRLRLEPGSRVLDVGCGAGQIAIPAARAGVRMTGVDIAPNLIARARERAAAERLGAWFEEGDAEALPYPDESFDTVVSLIGAMFAPRPERVAAELVRVCRPGGRVVMANWTPQGHVGRMFGVIGRHVPPPPLMPSPLRWGDAATARERLSEGTTRVTVTAHTYPMCYPFPPAQVVELFRTHYGPAHCAFAALDRAGQESLRLDLEALWAENNRATDGTTHVDAEYIEVTAFRA